MRIIIICLIVVLIAFTGHAIYYRTQTDKIMISALGAIPGAPGEAYRRFKPILEFNNLISFGKVDAAKQEFLNKMEKEIAQEMETSAPAPEYYQQARQAIQTLTDFDRDTRMDTHTVRQAIVQRAKDSMTRLRDHGTLSSWDALIAMFDTLDQNSQIPSGLFDDYNKWIAEVKSVDRRPLGLRDAIEGTSNSIRDALNHLGIMATSQDGPFVAPAPSTLNDRQLIEAEKSFNTGLGYLDHFKILFNEPQMPPELVWLQAKIEYDKGAIKLAHLQERGDTIKSNGSTYIADLLIIPNNPIVPSTAELVGSFLNGTHATFANVEQLFPHATTAPESMRLACAALSAWGDAQVLAVMGNEAGIARGRAEGWASGLGAPADAVVKAMRESPRVLLITQVP